jgi:hypothetical protein
MCDFECDWHTAARESKNNDVIATAIGGEFSRQYATGFGSVAEWQQVVIFVFVAK